MCAEFHIRAVNPLTELGLQYRTIMIIPRCHQGTVYSCLARYYFFLDIEKLGSQPLNDGGFI